eukprot:Plantae.Rhodophyta-Purpureofilum_apyrenoidigerum.ctg10320.p1 GENE.Plantae.Rhodophyta-Purpureofilum_apyrenoidigerum.ctg10320~~Plantae.Rhodophyta-Purpureofilum_apyrenoidigerum.ctg10320.p1  ORF type:complete len:419 (-),score=70.86 Plantae.Rhodophyta-Purpureofilum_apyrenoidigerum.ctg10320:13-1269(-)
MGLQGRRGRRVLRAMWATAVVLVVVGLSGAASSDSLQDYVVRARRGLHRIPEVGFQEVKTAEYLRSELDQLGVTYVHSLGGGTGIVGSIGKGNGPIVALRADMDALPVEEQTGLSYKSENTGTMHACGHDAHMAMLLGAARELKAMEKNIDGTVRIVFQPAEEFGTGADKMIKDRAVDGAKFIFGLHVDVSTPPGNARSRAGFMLAGNRDFQIAVEGIGGHAAFPHYSSDVILAASNIVTSIHTIISRNISPLSSAVISITQINGGTATNVLPVEVRIRGTIRFADDEVRKQIEIRVEEVARNVASAHRCTATVQMDRLMAATVNDPLANDLIQNSARAIGLNVSEFPGVMGSEDFGSYSTVAPSAFMLIGAGGSERYAHGPHNPKFDLDEGALELGARLHVRVALDAMKHARDTCEL